MEAGILLAACEYAIDADGVLAEVARNVEPSATVAVGVPPSLELDLQLGVGLVEIGFGHDVCLFPPAEVYAALMHVGFSCLPCLERQVELPGGVEREIGLNAHALHVEESCCGSQLPSLGG